MRKQKLSLPVVLGICLILCSLCLALVFQIKAYTGFKNTQHIVSQMNALLPEPVPGVLGMYPDSGMPALEIDGADYVALLKLPAFGVTLPVADAWDSSRPSHSPARFSGSAYDNSLVIGGVDDPRQLGFCDKIEHGALVTVTDMTGTQFAYTVSRVDRAKHADKEWLQYGDCDLTLFCRDLYSMEYIAVRCVFSYKS